MIEGIAKILGLLAFVSKPPPPTPPQARAGFREGPMTY
jgi:hypothetical protein